MVGTIAAVGDGVADRRPGDLVGVPWLGWADGTCAFCTSGRENLCPNARFTGYDVDGGDADAILADARFCLAVPPTFEPVAAAPFLCAGAIGYRAKRLAGEVERLGLYGFGNAARLVTQIARFEGRTVYAFTRPGDTETQRLALERGCTWAGDSTEPPPNRSIRRSCSPPPASSSRSPLRPSRLAARSSAPRSTCPISRRSRTSSCGGRVLRSVANLTRRDGEELLELAARIPLLATTRTFPLERAPEAFEAGRSRSDATPVIVPG